MTIHDCAAAGRFSAVTFVTLIGVTVEDHPSKSAHLNANCLQVFCDDPCDVLHGKLAAQLMRN